MRWIHLSDIHITDTTEGMNTSALRKDLISYLRGMSVHVDAIIVTGDYRHAKYQKNEEATIREFNTYMREISESVGARNNSIHIVPGNHDFIRDDDVKTKETINRIIKQYNVLEGRFSNDEDEEFLRKRFTSFFKSVKMIHPSNYNWASSLKPIHGYGLINGCGFLYLNTAITCGCEDDRGKIVIGADSVRQSLDSIHTKNPKAPIIVLAHHPLERINEEERKRLEYLFEQYPVKLYLCGDTHKAWCVKFNNVLEITMGALRQTTIETHSTFCFGEIDANGKMTFRAHQWDSTMSRWQAYSAFNDALNKSESLHKDPTPDPHDDKKCNDKTHFKKVINKNQSAQKIYNINKINNYAIKAGDNARISGNTFNQTRPTDVE